MQERMALIIPTYQGMSQSQDDGANQSQSIKKSSDNDDTRFFFTKVHLLASKLVLVMTIHSLGGSRSNWYHTPNPQPGATQPTQDKDHTSHDQSTRVSFDSPQGKYQEPLTITTIGVGDKHLPPLDDPRCSKPSRWRQPPRETSKSRSETRTSSASRCKHSNNAFEFSLNLTKMMNR
jgi:hypothetical protein